MLVLLLVRRSIGLRFISSAGPEKKCPEKQFPVSPLQAPRQEVQGSGLYLAAGEKMCP